MRVCVTGSRDWPESDRKAIELELMETQHFAGLPAEDMVLIHGAQRGADAIAARFCKSWGWKIVPFPAHWTRYRFAAGPIRNQAMVDIGKPDIVLAFPLPQSKGTVDMIERARAAGIEVRIHQSKEAHRGDE